MRQQAAALHGACEPDPLPFNSIDALFFRKPCQFLLDTLIKLIDPSGRSMERLAGGRQIFTGANHDRRFAVWQARDQDEQFFKAYAWNGEELELQF